MMLPSRHLPRHHIGSPFLDHPTVATPVSATQYSHGLEHPTHYLARPDHRLPLHKAVVHAAHPPSRSHLGNNPFSATVPFVIPSSLHPPTPAVSQLQQDSAPSVLGSLEDSPHLSLPVLPREDNTHYVQDPVLDSLNPLIVNPLVVNPPLTVQLADAAPKPDGSGPTEGGVETEEGNGLQVAHLDALAKVLSEGGAGFARVVHAPSATSATSVTSPTVMTNKGSNSSTITSTRPDPVSTQTPTSLLKPLSLNADPSKAPISLTAATLKQDGDGGDGEGEGAGEGEGEGEGGNAEIVDAIARAGSLVGYYESHLYDNNDLKKSDKDFVRISLKSASAAAGPGESAGVPTMEDAHLLWYNRAGEEWELIPTDKPLVWSVSTNCPYYEDGYKTSRVEEESAGNPAWISGPGGNRYIREDVDAGGRPHWQISGEEVCEAERQEDAAAGTVPLTKDKCHTLEGPFLVGSKIKCCEYDDLAAACVFVGGTCPPDLHGGSISAAPSAGIGVDTFKSPMGGLDDIDVGQTVESMMPGGKAPTGIAMFREFYKLEKGSPKLTALAFVVWIQVNLMIQGLAGLWCYQLGHLWADCDNPLRAMVCNPVIWWSREAWLDYECLNPCACDANPETFVPIPLCPRCDFPGRLPPSPASSWRALNTPIIDEGVSVDYARCSILPKGGDWRPTCPEDALIEDEIVDSADVGPDAK